MIRKVIIFSIGVMLVVYNFAYAQDLHGSVRGTVSVSSSHRGFSGEEHHAHGSSHVDSHVHYTHPHFRGTFFHRPSGHWHPRYNFYHHNYYLYPYVSVAPVFALSSNYITVPYNGGTYYYDQGAF